MKQNNEHKRKKVKTVKKKNLTMGMVKLLVVCLLIPFLALSVVLFYFSESKNRKQIEDTVITSLQNAAENSCTSIESLIQESKKVSYDGVVRDSYLEFVNNGDESAMYNTVSRYLDNTYKYSYSISSVILLFNEKTSMEYYTFSNIAGATYTPINDFKLHSMDKVKEIARGLGTDTVFVVVNDNLYLVRNLVTSDYKTFATLVMEINMQNMFKSLDNIVWRKCGLIYIDGTLLESMHDEEDIGIVETKKYVEKNKILTYKDGTYNYIYDHENAYAYVTVVENQQKITYVLKFDEIGLINENATLIYVYVIIFVLTLLLVALMCIYIYKNVNKPIAELVKMSEKIENGDYGVELPKFEENVEFEKLIDTYNHMSTSLKESFNRIYAEEVALRDANIQALQAQINPHFLNNTLEIINWKARISGNTDVSGMIESLSVMMEATMNRGKKAFITVAEEMKYIDAYLYIISQRFGSKFQFEKDIDENLLTIKIPRLIIQPIVENVVEHGGDKYGLIKGKLKMFMDDEYFHIVVENNGIISEEEQWKIDMLLTSNKLEEYVQNIGIRNVNLRLKLTYGDDSGLTIRSNEDGITISEIRISRDDMGKYVEQ